MNQLDPTIAASIQPWMPKDKSTRPTDRQLLGAVEHQFNVTPGEAHKWLYTLDFDGLSDQLIDEKRALS